MGLSSGACMPPGPKWGWWSLPLALFFLLMIVGLVGVRLLEQAGHVRTGPVHAAVSHSWIAIIFWLVCLLLVVQAWNLVVWLAHWAWAPAVSGGIPPRPVMLGVLVLVAVAAAWSLVEARLVRHHELKVYTTALPPGHPGLLIAQVSDVHLGPTRAAIGWGGRYGSSRRPGPTCWWPPGISSTPITAIWSPTHRCSPRSNPRWASSLSRGNHEFYTGIQTAVDFHTAAGFRLLRQEAVEVGPYLRLAGVDDPAGAGWRNHSLMEEDPLHSAVAERPVHGTAQAPPGDPPGVAGAVRPATVGHTHGGRSSRSDTSCGPGLTIFPGLHDLADGSRLYLSTGTGTWGPSMRLGCLAGSGFHPRAAGTAVTAAPRRSSGVRCGQGFSSPGRGGWGGPQDGKMLARTDEPHGKTLRLFEGDPPHRVQQRN